MALSYPPKTGRAIYGEKIKCKGTGIMCDRAFFYPYRDAKGETKLGPAFYSLPVMVRWLSDNYRGQVLQEALANVHEYYKQTDIALCGVLNKIREQHDLLTGNEELERWLLVLGGFNVTEYREIVPARVRKKKPTVVKAKKPKKKTTAPKKQPVPKAAGKKKKASDDTIRLKAGAYLLRPRATSIKAVTTIEDISKLINARRSAQNKKGKYRQVMIDGASFEYCGGLGRKANPWVSGGEGNVLVIANKTIKLQRLA